MAEERPSAEEEVLGGRSRRQPRDPSEAAEAHQTAVARGWRARINVGPCRRADAVAANENVARRTPAVGEGRLHRAGLSRDSGQACAEVDRNSTVFDALTEHSVQPSTAYHGTAAGWIAGRAVGHRSQLLAAAAPHDHVRGRVCVGEQPIAEAKRLEHGESVGRNVEKGACVVVGFGGGFEDLDVPPVGG